jgi:hypothetical protein
MFVRFAQIVDVDWIQLKSRPFTVSIKVLTMLKIWSEGIMAGDGTDGTDPINNLQDNIEALVHPRHVYD